MKRLAIIIGIILFLWVSVDAVDITMNQRLPLRKATHVDYDKAPWDTVFVLITDSTNSLVGDTIWLDSDEAGTYYGSWWPTGVGSYVANYHARWTDGSIIVVEEYFTVLDTVSFLGAAAGLTAKEILDSIEAKGWFAGVGGFACTVYTKLALDSTAMADVRIVAKNTSETVTLGHVRSNANGWAVLNLDSLAGGAYHHFWLTKPNYDFAFPESADVNGNTTVTFYGSVFDPGTPPSADLCRVYGWIYGVTGQPISGQKVEAKIETAPLRYGNIVISPYVRSTTTDTDGYWELDLYPNSVLNPSTTKYVFYIPRTPTGTILKVEVTVPDQESWELQW